MDRFPGEVMSMEETTEHDNEYDDAFVARLELLWGEGFLSPGGAQEVAELLSGFDLKSKRVLDIGCGIGGGLILIADHLQQQSDHVRGGCPKNLDRPGPPAAFLPVTAGKPIRQEGVGVHLQDLHAAKGRAGGIANKTGAVACELQEEGGDRHRV